jgi:hypothetical protein
MQDVMGKVLDYQIECFVSLKLLKELKENHTVNMKSIIEII